MDIMEEVFSFIRPWFYTSLCDYLLHFKHGLEYDSIHILICISTTMGEPLVVDRMYRSSYVLSTE